MTTLHIEHGTYAGYQKCKKREDGSCSDCREANAAYKAAYRKRAGVRRREVWQQDARLRAWSRLAAMHPAQYRALYEEELAR